MITPRLVAVPERWHREPKHDENLKEPKHPVV